MLIEYKDGSARIINPLPAFFAVDPREATSKKTSKESILLERIKGLASTTGIVYKVTCVLDDENKTSISYTNPANKPYKPAYIAPATYKKWKKKRLEDVKAAKSQGIAPVTIHYKS